MMITVFILGVPVPNCNLECNLTFSFRNGGVIFIGSHSHRFSAVSMATGSCIWEVTLGDRIESSACLSHCGNYVIVGRCFLLLVCRVADEDNNGIVFLISCLKLLL